MKVKVSVTLLHNLAEEVFKQIVESDATSFFVSSGSNKWRVQRFR